MGDNRGKKRAGKPVAQPHRQVWTDNDRLNLLAYLNWCVQHNVEFNETVIRHLSEVLKKNFTSRQVRDKLHREWTKYGTCDKFEDLFALGTAGLNPMEDEDQEISRIMKGLHSPRLPYRLRSASLAFTTRSRSRSIAPEVKTEPSARQRSSSIPNYRSRRAKEKKRQLISSPRMDDQPVETSLTNHAAVSEDEDVDMQSENAVNEDDSELSSVILSDEFDLDPPIWPNITEESGESTSSSTETNQVSGGLKRLQALEKDLLTHQGYVFTLKNKMSEMQREIDEMRHRDRVARPDQYELQEENWILTQKVRAKDRLLQQFRGREMSMPGLYEANITTECGVLYHEIGDACKYICDIDPNEDFAEVQDHFHQSAQTWSLKVSGWDMERLLHHCHSEDIPKDKLLSSLVAAAVFDLIFQPILPEILALECPLLGEYRKFIYTKDGHKALQELDIICLRSLTSKDVFLGEVIPQKTKLLLEFIWDTLRFLLPPDNLQRAKPSAAYDETTPESTGLGNALSLAMELKSQLMCSTRRYKFIFIKPGERFNPSYMHQDDGNFSVSLSGKHHSSADRFGESAEVNFCLFPALYSAPRDDSSDSPERHFAGNYDECTTEARLEELSSLTLMSPAIVLLK
ncbi:hypothetical protein B0I35DRAFT_439872 [Stachybotrys elegans]|uniref:Uncharacterized protein n=1 Tax=Stachybotrys elegans TaxID=80388 RepID=A0A8K0WNA6_9HYPO|nr:hypothetical protein B0I35DRAFT_439872 [Stachybotrys elegans]